MHLVQRVCIMAAAVLLPALLAVASSAQLPSGDTPALTQAAPADRHPVLALATIDGKTFDLASQRGKWVIVNYWATWCPPCTKSLPPIAQFLATHSDVTAVGVAFREKSKQNVLTYIHAHPSTYPVAWMASSDPQQPFGEINGIPATYVIAPDGTQMKGLVGQFDADRLLRLMQASGYPEGR